MPERLAFPVSAVSPRWFVDQFAPKIEAELDRSRVVWLVVEHPDEGDFLLERLRDHLNRAGRQCCELRVMREDPTLVWVDLVGSTDSSGILPSLRKSSVVLVFGATHLHSTLLDLRAESLERIARGVECSFIIPIHNRVANERNDFLKSGCTVPVPAFAECTKDDRQQIAKLLVEEAAHESDRSIPEWLPAALIEAGPLSRTELSKWVEYACSVEEVAIVPSAFPPRNLPRLHGSPERPVQREDLEGIFRHIERSLDEANTQFSNLFGDRLFRPVRELEPPLASGEPRAWFLSLISYAACLYFDSADARVLELAKLEGTPDGQLRYAHPHSFYQTVRVLRTRFQHGLDWTRSGDIETRSTAAAWFQRNCGNPAPRREHWRSLCRVFLREWDEAVRVMLEALKRMPSSPARTYIEQQLETVSRSLSLVRWQDLANEAAQRLQLPVDPREFVRIHQSKLAADLRNSVVRPQAVERTAITLIEQTLLARRDLPLTGKDLIEFGVPQGPQIRKVLQRARELFQHDPNLTREGLIKALQSDGLLPVS